MNNGWEKEAVKEELPLVHFVPMLWLGSTVNSPHQWTATIEKCLLWV